MRRRRVAIGAAAVLAVAIAVPVGAVKPDQPPDARNPEHPDHPEHPPAGNVLPTWPHWSPPPFGFVVPPSPAPDASGAPGAPPVVLLPDTAGQ